MKSEYNIYTKKGLIELRYDIMRWYHSNEADGISEKTLTKFVHLNVLINACEFLLVNKEKNNVNFVDLKLKLQEFIADIRRRK